MNVYTIGYTDYEDLDAIYLVHDELYTTDQFTEIVSLSHRCALENIAAASKAKGHNCGYYDLRFNYSYKGTAAVMRQDGFKYLNVAVSLTASLPAQSDAFREPAFSRMIREQMESFCIENGYSSNMHEAMEELADIVKAGQVKSPSHPTSSTAQSHE